MNCLRKVGDCPDQAKRHGDMENDILSEVARSCLCFTEKLEFSAWNNFVSSEAHYGEGDRQNWAFVLIS